MQNKLCEYCQKNPVKPGNRFCSRSCAATARNIQRGKKSAKALGPPPLCEYCHEKPVKRPSRALRYNRFCSITCRNRYIAARQTLGPDAKVCPVCGHIGYYRKHDLCAKHDPEITRWTEQEIAYLRAHYAADGAQAIADHLGFGHSQVLNQANRLGLKLGKVARRRIVHNRAAAYMRKNNPSHQPGARERMRKEGLRRWKDPKYRLPLLRGQQRVQKGKPTGLEKKLFAILDTLNLEYERFPLIKPKFIVDCRIGQIIIQADGDWWHGHPRFEPLRDRQKKQQARDRAQDAYLTACGYTVIRIWESDMAFDLVRDLLQEHGAISPP